MRQKHGITVAYIPVRGESKSIPFNKEIGTGYIGVKGKGKYSSSVKLPFQIKEQSLLNLTVEAADTVTNGTSYKRPAVTVIDTNGKKLSSKEYTVSEPSQPDSEGYSSVTVKGRNHLSSDSRTVEFRYYVKSNGLGNAKIKGRIANQFYTGRSVTLTEADLRNVLYVKDYALVPGQDFEISSYLKNIKKGTAKVTVRGIGSYSGMKTISFKIVAKSGKYQGALVDGSWEQR